jgi:hypothetical protein
VGTIVTAENFARAETDRMFVSLIAQAGGINRWHHSRQPTPIDQQPVVRMNRDTLYSLAVVDISEGATVTLPDAGARYLSVMVVNEDHFINDVFHDPGTYELTVDRFDTPYVVLAARVLVDPADPADLAEVARIQDGLTVEASSSRTFEPGDWDTASLDAFRADMAKRVTSGFDAAAMFGRREDVDPDKHLIGTAVGWGGLPETEAVYQGGPTDLPVGRYRLTVRDVPVDAFWSISVYDANGFFAPNDRDAYNVNSVTATKDPDGAVTVHFGGCEDGRPNCLPISEGWNYTVRLYRPRPEVRDRSYTFPTPEAVD